MHALVAEAQLVEERVSDLYSDFAERFLRDESLRELFYRMAREERHHADLLRLVQIDLIKFREDFLPLSVTRSSLEELSGIVEGGFERMNSDGFTERDAFEITTDIECSEMNWVVARVMETGSRWKKSFARGLLDTSGHLGRLVTCLDERGFNDLADRLKAQHQRLEQRDG